MRQSLRAWISGEALVLEMQCTGVLGISFFGAANVALNFQRASTWRPAPSEPSSGWRWADEAASLGEDDPSIFWRSEQQEPTDTALSMITRVRRSKLAPERVGEECSGLRCFVVRGVVWRCMQQACTFAGQHGVSHTRTPSHTYMLTRSFVCMRACMHVCPLARA